ncbi:hypothetical protein [Actinomadura coerulea]|uniref:hypothetical protein n=1 Tax=Actinomadura coerulea TaxID=46159 RepID=UPI0034444CA5
MTFVIIVGGDEPEVPCTRIGDDADQLRQGVDVAPVLVVVLDEPSLFDSDLQHPAVNEVDRGQEHRRFRQPHPQRRIEVAGRRPEAVPPPGLGEELLVGRGGLAAVVVGQADEPVSGRVDPSVPARSGGFRSVVSAQVNPYFRVGGSVVLVSVPATSGAL